MATASPLSASPMTAGPPSTDNADEQRPLDQIPVNPPGSSDNDIEDDDGGNLLGADKEQLTVFHSADNFNVKHPLINKWTLWFTKPPSGKGGGADNWADCLKEVVTFDSVEEFWGIYNNITKTSELALKSDYHLFKAGIRPEWEDVQNKYGGKWAYQFREKRTVAIDDLWLNVMLAAIGETMEGDGVGEVMGVVVNVRKAFYRIGVWTKTTGDAGGRGKKVQGGATTEELLEIGKRFKDVLKLESAADKVEFSGHTDSAHAGSTRAKAKHTV